tara:strand:- start:2939 stop:3304 length:366 start_codon:yes stop_codon:yes gene_type:complete
MRSIAANHYRNDSRKASKRLTVPLLDTDLEQIVEARHIEREREEVRKRRALQRCMEKLPERQRVVVEGFYLEGDSLETLGERNDRKPNAIAQLLHRARQSLIDCVRRDSHRDLEGEGFHQI